jgi:predicted metal-dependent peptidase
VPVERRGLGTLAVDAHWRLYFDPDYLASVDEDCAALIILHEVSHLLLKHHERGRKVSEWELWNVATDCSINERLQAEGHVVPPDWLLPARFQLPANQTAEQYYRQLKDRQDDDGSQQDQPTDTKNADEGEAGPAPEFAAPPVPAVKPGTSGSCSDGRQRAWEDSPPRPDAPDEDLSPAMPKHEQDQVLRDVAERIAKQAGSGVGNWSRWAQEIISPRIDPKALLIAAVRQAVEQTNGGHDDTSYRRPSRRQSVGGAIRTGPVTIVPRVLMIVDSSGSMSQRDLGLALGLIGKVLNGFRLRDGVRVMVGDSAVQSVEKVFDPKKLEIKGGGGTEMDTLLVEAAKATPRPQLIIVATDGCTSWPALTIGIPVVACLTQDTTAANVPTWIRTIVLSRR